MGAKLPKAESAMCATACLVEVAGKLPTKLRAEFQREILFQLKEPTSLDRSRVGLPHNGSVALVLRGQSFRRGCSRCRKRVACTEAASAQQQLAAQSLLDMIVGPLERRGNNVRMFICDNPCNLTSRLLVWYGRRRILAHDSFFSKGQSDNMRRALDLFKAATSGSAVAMGKNDLVIVTRHDVVWKSPIDRWSADFGRLNFHTVCEMYSKEWSRSTCVGDILHMMPGDLFPAFDAEIGRGRCFVAQCSPPCDMHAWQRDTGHACYDQMVGALGYDHIGFATDWVPQMDLRETNGFANLYGEIDRDPDYRIDELDGSLPAQGHAGRISCHLLNSSTGEMVCVASVQNGNGQRGLDAESAARLDQVATETFMAGHDS